MKRIYLSGPMTGMPDFNFPAFNAEAARLRALGYDVINPVDINPDTTTPYNECLRNDLKALLTCDTIAMLDGWMNSNGAHLEMHIAHRVGIRVVDSRGIHQPAVRDGDVVDAEWPPNSFDLVAHLRRQRDFSLRTFGPGDRAAGVVDHIRKELTEIESDPNDLSEWIDVVLLALDGAWRQGYAPWQIAGALAAKQAMNEGLANGYDLNDTGSSMTKLPLERPRKISANEFPWSACAPFVENSRGTLIHRPRSGATYNLHRLPHVGVSFWCGMSVSSDGKNLTFLAAPPEDKILCARCEAMAVANWMPSADELAGRHVHVGRTVAVMTCCGKAAP